MSIIGELWEEDWSIMENCIKEKCVAFLTYLNQKMANCDEGYFAIWSIAEEFKEKFANELEGKLSANC